MTTREAVRVVLRWLLAAIRANEDGVLRGEDPEHLHDFRVAIRRTRTLLSELPGALPERPTDRFRQEFKWLGRGTGPIRDLDVWIEKMSGYEARLPERTRADLRVFESRLRLRRDRERVRLVRALRSARYTNTLQDWDEFLWRPATGGTSRDIADRPISEVASARISKAYRKAVKQGRKVEPASPSPVIHKLRIRCKELRYLLEFFGGLYAPEAIATVIAELKELQDHLGDYNDCAVQRRLLPEFVLEIGVGGRSAGGAGADRGQLRQLPM
jgi:CHAD domain-containing protein